MMRRRCALLLSGLSLLATLCVPARAATPAEQQAMYLHAVELMTEGRHAEATAAFERLIALVPQHAGAWLELAISHCTLGHPVEAEKLFREIEVRFAPSAGILAVIDANRRTGCKAWEPRTYRAMAVSFGTDDNVNQGASNPVFTVGSGPDRTERLLDEDFLPKRDSFVQTSFDYSRELTQQHSTAFAQLRMRRHHTVSEQDTNALLFGVNHPFRLGRWSGNTMLSASLVSLDGSLYQRQYQVQARVAPPLQLPEQFDLSLTASLGRAEYVTRRNFDADTGELSTMLNYRGKRNHAQLSAGALFERGRAGRLGGDRHGFYASLQMQHRFGERLGGEVGLTRQDWMSEREYAPDIIDLVRRQRTLQARVALVRPLTAKQSVLLEYRHVTNRENISLFQYSSNSLQLYWRWNGF